MIERPERRLLEEAFADAWPDWVHYGGIYVIRTANGTYRSIDPARVTIRGDGYEVEPTP